MDKIYLIKDLQDEGFYYEGYQNGWTRDANEALFFDAKEEAEYEIENNRKEFSLRLLQIIEITLMRTI